jgi:hypothetical protein
MEPPDGCVENQQKNFTVYIEDQRVLKKAWKKIKANLKDRISHNLM